MILKRKHKNCLNESYSFGTQSVEKEGVGWDMAEEYKMIWRVGMDGLLSQVVLV